MAIQASTHSMWEMGIKAYKREKYWGRGGEDYCRTFGGSTQKEKSLKIVYNKVGLGDVCSFPLGEDSTYFFNRPYVLLMKES